MKEDVSAAMCCKDAADTLLSMAVTDGVTVNILPNPGHEFLMTTKEVAAGYGLSPGTIRRHAQEHQSELIEGKHFFRGVQIMNDAATGGATRTTMWTKRGIVRLGFFIRSERARLFRDWGVEFGYLKKLSIFALDNYNIILLGKS